MTLEDIFEVVKPLKGVTQDIKWENHVCFNVGAKMFLVTAPDSIPVTASFKVSDDNFTELTQREGIIPAPYMARHKWVFVDDINRLSKKEWQLYARGAYHLIGGKLSAKLKKSLGIE